MRLIVFGSRTWSDRDTIGHDLREAYEIGYTMLVHGACASGADYFADLIWRAASVWIPALGVERHPADWKTHGKAAGPLRNEHMAALGADLAIGYRLAGESRGTDDMRRACERHGIPLVRRGWGWA